MRDLRPTVTRDSKGSGLWMIVLLLGLAAVLIATGLAPRWLEELCTTLPPLVQSEPLTTDAVEPEVAVAPQPATPETLDDLLDAYDAALAENDLAGALRQAGAYVKAAPEDAYGYALRGYVHWLRSRCDSAIADMNQAIALSSNYGYAYFARASCLFVMGKLEAAQRDARDAVIYAQSGEEAGYSRELVGWLAYAQGRFGDAITAFTAVGQGGDGMAEAGLWLAHAREGRGWDGAMQAPSWSGEHERLVFDVLAGRQPRALLETAARNGGLAAFYLAQLELVEGRNAEALALLESYTRKGFSTEMAHPVARAQLRWLR